MAYIGNVPSTQRYSIDSFSGNGSNRDFTLRDAPVSPASIMVFVDGAYKSTQQYTVTGSNLNLNVAPNSGTNNIQVIFLGITTAIGPVTDGSVTGNKIANGTITGEKMGQGAISANNIAPATITGDKLGLGAVSANNIAPNVFISVSNVTIAQTATFLGPIYEKANVVSTSGLPSAVTMPTTDTSILVYTGPSVANSTINFTGLAGVGVGNVSTYTIVLNNTTGSEKYISNVQIDGSEVYPKWAGEKPTFGQANTEYYSFVIVKTSATPTYNVLAQVTNFS